jgi:hypothetical protein
MSRIRFKFAAEKAKAALHWMVRESGKERGALDLHAALKACYFADKDHLNEHERPIFGATYRAMKFGPVPLEIYEMAKGEALWLAELDADELPWRLNGFKLSLQQNSKPDLSSLAESNFEALKAGFERSLNMSFNERTAATHGPDWQAAQLGLMDYADMIEESPRKKRIVRYLEENGRFMRL